MHATASASQFALILFLVTACRSSEDLKTRLVVVNSPAAGEIRRVLVAEGAEVTDGSAIVEIAVQKGVVNQPGNKADPEARARAVVRATQEQIAAAEADAQRALVEVQRVERLVAQGFASQAELEAARATYQQAQERLQRLREQSQSAQDNLALQHGRPSSTVPAAREEIISVRVTASGTVRAISARVGQRVTQGQPLATISTDKR